MRSKYHRKCVGSPGVSVTTGTVNIHSPTVTGSNLEEQRDGQSASFGVLQEFFSPRMLPAGSKNAKCLVAHGSLQLSPPELRIRKKERSMLAVRPCALRKEPPIGSHR
eukprot:954373-Pelagomonas_calceolata.AAC.1